MHALEFEIEDTRYAVPLARVVEVVPRVWLTPLPDVPAVIAGVFNYRGAVTVAVDLRARLGHPPRPASVNDHLLVVRSARRVVALVVDRVLALRVLADDALQALSPPVAHLRGVVAREEGLLLVEDLDAALSLDEERAADLGMERLNLGP